MELKLLLNPESIDHVASELAEPVRPLILEGGTSSSMVTTDQLTLHLHLPRSWVYDRTRLRKRLAGSSAYLSSNLIPVVGDASPTSFPFR
jgi:hypothetical protein